MKVICWTIPLHSWFVTDPKKVQIKTGSHKLSPISLSILLQSAEWCSAVWQVYNKMLCLISVWCVVTNKLREQPTAEETNFSFLPLAHCQYHCHQPSSPRQSPLLVEVLLRTKSVQLKIDWNHENRSEYEIMNTNLKIIKRWKKQFTYFVEDIYVSLSMYEENWSKYNFIDNVDLLHLLWSVFSSSTALCDISGPLSSAVLYLVALVGAGTHFHSITLQTRNVSLHTSYRMCRDGIW